MTSKDARRPTSIDDLDDSSLCRVFSSVAAKSRRALPAVCRRWRSLCDVTPSVWDHVHLNFCTRRLAGCRRSLMYKWLLKRRESVQRLTIVGETGACTNPPPAPLCCLIVAGLHAAALLHAASHLLACLQKRI